MAATVTIRVTTDTRERLNRISGERGISAGELVRQLAVEAEERALLDTMERHYEELRLDPGAWAAHLAEIAAWEATAGDGVAPPA